MEAPTGAMWLPQHVCRLMHPNILKLEHPQNSPTFTPKSWFGLVKMMFSFEQHRLFSGSNAINLQGFQTQSSGVSYDDLQFKAWWLQQPGCWCQETGGSFRWWKRQCNLIKPLILKVFVGNPWNIYWNPVFTTDLWFKLNLECWKWNPWEETH